MEFVGIDKFSLLDYDKQISVVLFFPICNFRCPFCHNGDSVLSSTTYIPFEEILEYLKKRRNLVDAVVISGGEPTLMPELIDRIKQIKELGYKIKLDTNGTKPEVIKELLDLKLLDYIAMDIKNDLDNYALISGCHNVDTNKILESIKLIENSDIDYEFRTTLVKEFHDIENIKRMAILLKGAKKLFLQKFIDREGVIKKGLHSISEEEALKFKDILIKDIDEVNLRGY